MTASRFFFLFFWVAPHVLQIPIDILLVERCQEFARVRVAQHARLRLLPGLPLYFNWLLEKAA